MDASTTFVKISDTVTKLHIDIAQLQLSITFPNYKIGFFPIEKMFNLLTSSLDTHALAVCQRSAN